jgi:hypothetical protein
MNLDILKTPSKKVLLKLGKRFFYLIILTVLLIYAYPSVNKTIGEHQKRRDEQLIDNFNKKQDSLQKIFVKYWEVKFDTLTKSVKAGFHITNYVLSKHIIQTVQDKKEVEKSIRELYNGVFYEKKNISNSIQLVKNQK